MCRLYVLIITWVEIEAYSQSCSLYQWCILRANLCHKNSSQATILATQMHTTPTHPILQQPFLPKIPFLPERELPWRTQNLMCLTPHVISSVAEWGLNWTSKIRSLCPRADPTTLPRLQSQTFSVWWSSRPTDARCCINGEERGCVYLIFYIISTYEHLALFLFQHQARYTPTHTPPHPKTIFYLLLDTTHNSSHFHHGWMLEQWCLSHGRPGGWTLSPEWLSPTHIWMAPSRSELLPQGSCRDEEPSCTMQESNFHREHNYFIVWYLWIVEC